MNIQEHVEKYKEDNPLFPFTLYYCENRHEHGLFDFFHEHRPAEMTWYEFDLRVHSESKCEFIIYGMDSFVNGGRGREKARIEVDQVPEKLKPFIDGRKKRLARELFEERERIMEEERIALGIQTAYNDLWSD